MALADHRRYQPMPYQLKINGKTTTVDVPADMPLLWVLRDVLDLKGTKFGCGVAQCGACMVHVAGTATRSCILPAPPHQCPRAARGCCEHAHCGPPRFPEGHGSSGR